MMINGRVSEIPGRRLLSDIIAEEGFSEDRIAVELNGKVVPRKDYGSVSAGSGDSVEIVGFVGGG